MDFSVGQKISLRALYSITACCFTLTLIYAVWIASVYILRMDDRSMFISMYYVLVIIICICTTVQLIILAIEPEQKDPFLYNMQGTTTENVFGTISTVAILAISWLVTATIF